MHSNNLKKDNSKIFNQIKLTYLLELLIPTFFTTLFYLFLKSKNYTEKEGGWETVSYVKFNNEILWIFSLSFFLVIIAEWMRRNQNNKSEHFIIKYAYILLILFAFILGIWFTKEFQNITETFVSGY